MNTEIFRINMSAARFDAAVRAMAQTRSMGYCAYWIEADTKQILIDAAHIDGRSCRLTFDPAGSLICISGEEARA